MMNKIKKIILSILIIVCCFSLFSLIACDSESSGQKTTEQETKTIVVENKKEIIVSFSCGNSLSLYEQEEKTISVTAENFSGSITWGCSDTSIAEVNQEGKVVAKKKGTCVVFANAGGVLAECIITVLDNPNVLTLNTNYVLVDKDETFIILPTYSYQGNVVDCVKTFESSNIEIATVNSDGEITGVNFGEAIITVKAVYGNKELTQNVYVTVKESGGIYLSESQIDMTVFNSGSKISDFMTFSVEDKNGKVNNPAVTWELADEEVVTLSNDTIIVNSVGETMLTAKYTTLGGCEFSSSVKINVNFIEKNIEEKMFVSTTQANTFNVDSVVENEDIVSITFDGENLFYEQNDNIVSLTSTFSTIKCANMIVKTSYVKYIYPVQVVTMRIATKDDFTTMRERDTKTWQDYYVLTNDIDFENTGYNSDNKNFRGTFDGNGHQIKNFVLTWTNKEGSSGLFGRTLQGNYGENTVVLKDFSIINVTGGGNKQAVLAGYAFYTEIQNVYIEGSLRGGQIAQEKATDIENTTYSNKNASSYMIYRTSNSVSISNCIIVDKSDSSVTRSSGLATMISYNVSPASFLKITNCHIIQEGGVDRETIFCDEGNVDCDITKYDTFNKFIEESSDSFAIVSIYERETGFFRWGTFSKQIDGEVISLGENFVVDVSVNNTSINFLSDKTLDKIVIDNKELAFTQNGKDITFSGTNYSALTCGDKEGYLVIGEKAYSFDCKVVSKVITTAEDFKAMRDLIHNNFTGGLTGKYYLLGNDIDFEGEKLVLYGHNTQVATNGMRSVFDGNGYAVKNFYIDSSSNNSLFTEIGTGGVIKNTTFIYADNQTLRGAVVARNVNGGTIINVCVVVNSINDDALSAGICVLKTKGYVGCSAVIYKGGNLTKANVIAQTTLSDCYAVTSATYQGYQGTKVADVCALYEATRDNSLKDVITLQSNKIYFATTEIGSTNISLDNIAISCVDTELTISEIAELAVSNVYLDNEEISVTQNGTKLTISPLNIGEYELKITSGIRTYTCKLTVSNVTVNLTNRIDISKVDNNVVITGLTEDVTSLRIDNKDIEFTQDASDKTKLTISGTNYDALSLGTSYDLSLETATKLYTGNVFIVTKILKTADDMKELFNAVESNFSSGYCGYYYILGNSIDMGGYSFSTKTHNTQVATNGMRSVLDGCGYAITNFKLNWVNSGSLFTEIGTGGKICNVTFEYANGVTYNGYGGLIASNVLKGGEISNVCVKVDTMRENAVNACICMNLMSGGSVKNCAVIYGGGNLTSSNVLIKANGGTATNCYTVTSATYQGYQGTKVADISALYDATRDNGLKDVLTLDSNSSKLYWGNYELGTYVAEN